MKGDEFEILLSEGGPFVVDMSTKVSRILLFIAASSGSLKRETKLDVGGDSRRP